MPPVSPRESSRHVPQRRSRASVAARPVQAPPHRRYDLVAVALMAVGLLVLVALARPGAAGPLGDLLVRGLRYTFGLGAWASPPVFWSLGLAFVLDRRHRPPLDVMTGSILLFTALLVGLHVHVPIRPGLEMNPGTFWRHGGWVGAMLGQVLVKALGRVGTDILLGALSIVSLLLITDKPLARTCSHYVQRSGDRARRTRATVQSWKEQRDVVRQQRTRANVPALNSGSRSIGPAPSRLWDRKSKSELPAVVEPEEFVEPMGPALLGPEADGEDPWETESEENEDEPQVIEAEAPPMTPTVVKRKGPLDFLEPEPPGELASGLVPPKRISKAAPTPPTPSKRIVGTGDEAFELPGLDLLNSPGPPVKITQADREANIRILEETLADFRIDAKVVEICHGPTVTRYEIRLAPGTYVKKILNLADNIAMSLAAIAVRVEAPIPGKSAIGVEVPNRQPTPVGLRQILDTPEFMQSPSLLTIALGADVANTPKYADITKMPHLLVGGSTNSGKSVCLNAILCSLLFRATPEDLKLLLIDPKRVELSLYDGIPHLVYPVVKDVRQAPGVLRWAIKEMMRRYDLLVAVGARNIDSYNKKRPEGERKLPYIVIVIDELADLMMQQGPEVEGSICRLAQLARAVGIHLIIATQRPSVDVITGTIKANISSRIAFAVASGVDSKTILDHTGAERLVGRGDMLFLPIDAPKAVRIQGAYIHESEIEALVNHLKAQGAPDYEAEVVTVEGPAMGKDTESDDQLFEKAVRLVVTTGQASTSLLQRKFNVGYGRAARLIDMMEARAIVGPMNNARGREVLLPKEAIDSVFTGTGKAEAMTFDEE